VRTARGSAPTGETAKISKGPRLGWDPVPIQRLAFPRRCGVNQQGRRSLVGEKSTFFLERLGRRACGTSNKYHHIIGGSGGQCAWATARQRRSAQHWRIRRHEPWLTVQLSSADGDLNYAPGVLWTAASPQDSVLILCTTIAAITRRSCWMTEMQRVRIEIQAGRPSH